MKKITIIQIQKKLRILENLFLKELEKKEPRWKRYAKWLKYHWSN